MLEEEGLDAAVGKQLLPGNPAHPKSKRQKEAGHVGRNPRVSGEKWGERGEGREAAAGVQPTLPRRVRTDAAPDGPGGVADGGTGPTVTRLNQWSLFKTDSPDAQWNTFSCRISSPGLFSVNTVF